MSRGVTVHLTVPSLVTDHQTTSDIDTEVHEVLHYDTCVLMLWCGDIMVLRAYALIRAPVISATTPYRVRNGCTTLHHHIFTHMEYHVAPCVYTNRCIRAVW